MLVPALMYLAINAGRPVVHGAWATPTATDIAFALAALAAASRRLPASLRVFLLTLAVVDDMGAVGLIGVLFTHDLRPRPLAGVGLTLAALAAIGRWRSAPFLAYGVGIVLAWAFSIQSGVATSLTAVLAAMTVPVEAHKRARDGMLQQMMHSLHPYVAYVVLPLFAFAAAGFSFQGFSPALLERPALLGILAGLFLGKQLGVFAAAFLASALKLGRKPTGATWLEIYGVALLCGVGFTMSLFIGGLAFRADDAAGQADMRIGVILASLLSGAMGMAVLAWAGARRADAAHADGS
jgi:NhaA family Na+:H+ antiporter